MTEFAVAVRTLAAFCYRSGDIDHRYLPGPTGEQGIEGHQAVYRQRPESYRSEYPVKHVEQVAGVRLRLRGRADGFDESRALVEEIKTCRVDPEQIPQSAWSVNWAQGKLYAALISRSLNMPSLTVRLTWYNIDTGDEHSSDEVCDAGQLEAFLSASLQRFGHWLAQLAERRQRRDASLAELDFPYPAFRSGQREAAELVYKCVDQAGTLLLEAPTGIGKTPAVLFPALKAMTTGKHDGLLFLTAKDVGRLAAEDTLAHFVDAGFDGWPLSLSAKERICLSPGHACHASDCPYAEGYYDKLPAALDAAIAQPRLRRDDLQALAREYGVCPYQLSLDLLPWVDTVIADLHYLFSPTALLTGTVADGDARWSVLVDEAHNLPDRARGMYGASLAKAAVMAARREANGAVKRGLDAVNRVLLTLDKLPWDEEDFHALPDCPEVLASALQRFAGEVSERLGEEPAWLTSRPRLQDVFFDILQVLRLLDLWGPEFRLELSRDGTRQGLVLGINCLDPARLIGERLAGVHAFVAFSATLSPLHWTVDRLGLPAGTVQRRLPSPFDPQQLEVSIDVGIDTRFRARQQSMPALARRIEQWLADTPGNCIVYFPSYRYLEDCLAQLLLPPDRQVWRQAPGQDDAARGELREQLAAVDSVTAFCILGGVFGEGIDLPGELLRSVIVVGVGLPQFNRDTEAQRDWFEQRYGDGFACAYLYPGMQKVAQALGRVVRHETDRGSALLIDSRYRQGEYRQLLPPAWSYREIGS